MNGGSTGKVNDSHFKDPTAACPYPVCNGEVHENSPDGTKDQPAIVFRAIGNRSRDQTHGQTSKHSLESNEGHDWQCGFWVICHETLEAKEFCWIPDHSSDIGTESQRVSKNDPEDAHDEGRTHDHHEHVQDGFRTDHSAVKERQTWDHEHHHRRGSQHPGRVT